MRAYLWSIAAMQALAVLVNFVLALYPRAQHASVDQVGRRALCSFVVAAAFLLWTVHVLSGLP